MIFIVENKKLGINGIMDFKRGKRFEIGKRSGNVWFRKNFMVSEKEFWGWSCRKGILVLGLRVYKK